MAGAQRGMWELLVLSSYWTLGHPVGFICKETYNTRSTVTTFCLSRTNTEQST